MRRVSPNIDSDSRTILTLIDAPLYKNSLSAKVSGPTSIWSVHEKYNVKTRLCSEILDEHLKTEYRWRLAREMIRIVFYLLTKQNFNFEKLLGIKRGDLE